MITILKVIVAIVVVAMVGSFLIAYSILTRADRTGFLVVKSHRALAAAEETLRRALEADSGVRSYLVTRDRVDLVPFERADQMIQHTMDDLQEHVGGEPERQSVQRLRAEMDGLFIELRSLIARTGNSSAPGSGDRDEARAHVVAIRMIVREIRRAEDALLAERVAADAAATRSVSWFAMVAAVVAAALAAASAALFLFMIRPGWGR